MLIWVILIGEHFGGGDSGMIFHIVYIFSEIFYLIGMCIYFIRSLCDMDRADWDRTQNMWTRLDLKVGCGLSGMKSCGWIQSAGWHAGCVFWSLGIRSGGSVGYVEGRIRWIYLARPWQMMSRVCRGVECGMWGACNLWAGREGPSRILEAQTRPRHWMWDLS